MKLTNTVFGIILAMNLLLIKPLYSQKEINSNPVNDSTTKASNELINIGYGNERIHEVTGSVYKLDSSGFNQGMYISPLELIIGQVPGLSISSNDGTPGGNFTIYNRGNGSFTFNDPLIVLDDVPLIGTSIPINGKDIEDITILKDVTVAGIYGSKASNGVISITTKKGDKGFKLEYNGQFGVSFVPRIVDVLSGDQMRSVINSLPFDLNAIPILGSANTNWQNEIYQTAFGQDHQLSVSGTYGFLPYRVSLGITDQEGVLKTSVYNRNTISIVLNPKFFHDALQFIFHYNGIFNHNKMADENAVGNAISFDPTQNVMGESPLFGNYFQWAALGAPLGTPNPVEELEAANNESTVSRNITNIQIHYNLPFIPGLQASLNYAADNNYESGHANLPTTAPITLTSTVNGTGKLDNFETSNLTNLLEAYLNYSTKITSIYSRLDLTAGYSETNTKTHAYDYTRSMLVNPFTWVDSTYWSSTNPLYSYFGRFHYSLLNRYFLSILISKDVTNKFIPANNNKSFPAASFAWQIKNEPFLKSATFLSDLKLRIGWGRTGQQSLQETYNFSPINTLITTQLNYQIGPNIFIPNLNQIEYAPDITWETITTKDIGLDFGWLHNRISGTLDLYNRITDNMLTLIPMGINYSEYLCTNLGNVQNKGYEISLKLIPIMQHDFIFTLGFNFAYNHNNLTNMTEDGHLVTLPAGDLNLASGYLQLNQQGSPMNSFFVNKQVYNTNGKPIEGLYVDLSGKGGAVYQSPQDEYIDHNPMPDYTMGICLHMNWKDLDLSTSGRVSLGNYVYNEINASESYNQIYQSGFIKNMPANLLTTQFMKAQFASDYFVQNASYFKLDYINLGYRIRNIDNKFNTRISFTVQNVFTSTNYSGQDPEQVSGFETGTIPRPRVFSLGLSIEM